MKSVVFVITFIVLVNYNLMAQRDTTFVIDTDIDYLEDLKKVLEDTSLEHLTILVPENYDSYKVYGRINGEVDYEHVSNFYNHKVESLPETLGDLINLKSLNISGLGLTSLPASIVRLVNLKSLHIGYNDLSINNELQKLQQLEHLETLKLYGCSISFSTLLGLEKLKLKEGFYYKLEDAEKEKPIDKKYFKPNKRNRQTFDLLKDVYKFYPIGVGLHNSYPGYIRLKSIVSNKIDKLYKNEPIEPWYSLFNEFKNTNSGITTMNLVSYQFPNYKLSFLISDETENNIRIRKGFSLIISLLTDHYTLYFESDMFFNDFKINDRATFKTFYYGEKNAKEQDLILLNKTKALVGKYFPTHTFIDHYTLFKTKIAGGLPYGQDSENLQERYPIFNFLFDTDNSKRNIVVE